MPIIQNGEFDLQALSTELQAVIFAAGESAMVARTPQIGTSFFLMALFKAMNEPEEEVLQEALLTGVEQRNLADLFRDVAKPRVGATERMFTGVLADFSPMARKSLAYLDQISAGGQEGFPSPTLPNDLVRAHLWIAALSHLEVSEAGDLRELIDVDKALEGFRELLAQTREIELPPLYSEDPGEMLLLARLDEVVIDALKRAAELAGGMGYEKIMPAHIAIVLFGRPDGVGEWLVRRHAKIDVGPAKVVAEIEGNISLGYRGQPRPLDLSRSCLAIPTQRALEAAFRKAARHGKAVIDEPSLMYGVLSQEVGQRVEAVFRLPALEMDLQRMLRHLDRYIKDAAASKDAVLATPFLLPKTVAKSEDLTYLARSNRLPPAIPVRSKTTDLPPMEQIKRGLHKRENNHILITGAEGVGKTTLVRELARQIATEEIGFLAHKKLVWVDCSEIGPEESRAKLDEIITAVKGRNDVLLCLDGIDALIRYIGQRESNNLTQLKTALRNGHIHLIGILLDRHFNELLASDYQLLKFFTRVEVGEPDAELSIEILRGLKPALEDRYGIQIEDEAIQRAVILARDFVMSERLPVKAIEALEEGCELVSYQADTAAGAHEAGAARKPTLTAEHIIETIALKTGVAESTLRGSGNDIDFEALLGQQVVGQDEAVEAVAREMKLIKGGAKDPTKPASIMLFAGLTGTGKTELAKALAQVYSASKKLTVYTMGNFNDSHSVSGIVGVPPGYVGYEMGGRLINDLNADPYSVVLLDEVEKAHPDIWKPFLNLFDEGWMVDQRNVRAYGNRAIFILTSNAGAKEISQGQAEDKSMAAIIEAVKQKLRDTVHETSRQKCFTPEFLARITQIIIFNPLSLEAMQKITDLKLRRLVRDWQEKRNKTLQIRPEVYQQIAEMGFADNNKSGGNEGGRIILKHIATRVETPLMDEVAKHPDEYQRASKVVVSFDPAGRTLVQFEGAELKSPRELSQQVADQIGAIVHDRPDSLVKDRLAAVEQLLRTWEQGLRDWTRKDPGKYSVNAAAIQQLRLRAETIGRQVHPKEQEMQDQLLREIRELAAALSECEPVKSPFDIPSVPGGC